MLGLRVFWGLGMGTIPLDLGPHPRYKNVNFPMAYSYISPMKSIHSDPKFIMH